MRNLRIAHRLGVTFVLVTVTSTAAWAQESSCAVPRILAGKVPKARIVNGEPARPGQWPTYVALMAKFPNQEPELFCGGTIIGKRAVLTAAHCIAGMDKMLASDSRVKFTAKENPADLAARSGRDIPVTAWTKHEGYNPNSNLNDVGVLTLADNATAPSQKLVAADRRTEAIDGGCVATVAGFGRTSEGGKISPRLLQTDLPLIRQAECRNKYGANLITDANFCAGFLDGRTDACQGDSGGPLSVPDPKSGEMMQIGVVSWGNGCARKEEYGVYASVGQFESWIKQRVPEAVFLSKAIAVKPADETLSHLTDNGPIAPNPSDLAMLSISISEGNSVKVGSDIEIQLTSSVDGVVAIFSENPDGTAKQIYPSKAFPASDKEPNIARIKAGKPLAIPSSPQILNGYRIRIQPPLGQSALRALVVPERGPLVEKIKENFDGRTLPNLVDTLAAIIKIEAATRGAEGGLFLPTDRAVASVTYDIVK